MGKYHVQHVSSLGIVLYDHYTISFVHLLATFSSQLSQLQLCLYMELPELRILNLTLFSSNYNGFFISN